jgi:hypothetical protein
MIGTVHWYSNKLFAVLSADFVGDIVAPDFWVMAPRGETPSETGTDWRRLARLPGEAWQALRTALSVRFDSFSPLILMLRPSAAAKAEGRRRARC